MPTYAITGTTSLVSLEGDTITYNISTTGVPDGAVLYWKNLGTTDAKDFYNNKNNGFITINASTSSLSLQVIKDYKVDSNYLETIIIQLRTDSASGPVVATALTEYVVDTSKKLDLVPVNLPNLPLIQVPIGNYPLHVTTITNALNLPLWEKTGNLGSLQIGETSELYIKSNTTQTFSLVYEKLSGDLPPGLTLQRDGTIVGHVSTSIQSTATDYTFTASYSKIVGSPISTGSFTLTILRNTTTVYTPIWFEPVFSIDQRVIINNFLNNESIFAQDYLYRPLDENFGKSKKLKFFLYYGLQNTTNDGLVAGLNFYKRRFTLSNPKIAYGKDEFEDIIYEVIYSDIIDYNTNSLGESVAYTFSLGQTYHPSSIANMKRRLGPEETFLVGRKTTEEYNPKFMASRQTTNTNVLGYIPCVIYCYTLPKKGKIILDRIKKYNINFNDLDFTIDRYYKRNLIDSQSIDVIKFSNKPQIS